MSGPGFSAGRAAAPGRLGVLRHRCFSIARLVAVTAALISAAASPNLRAYALIGGSWPSGTVTLQLQLDATAPSSPALPLTDGSTTWDAVAVAAMNDWNDHLGRTKLQGVASTSTATEFGDSINSVFFSKSVYGSSFDQFTLAVTLVDYYDHTDGRPTVRNTEADLVVNANRTWNSYRGAVRTNPGDLRRVLLHELGHVLGLDHPDQADPAQSVAAIMNSAISNIETLQVDDLSGINYLYGTPLTKPTITMQPASQTLPVAGQVTFRIGVDGAATTPAAEEALRSYVWYFKAAGAAAYERIPADDAGTLAIGSVQMADAGAYYVEVMSPDPDKTVQSNPAELTVTPIPIAPATSLKNLSTRGTAGSGSSTMIVGFNVAGTQPKNVLLRAVGPGLADFGVSGRLADPILTLTTQGGSPLGTSTVPWDGAANAAQIRTVSGSVGAFPLAPGSHDAVILTTLPPGNYTAQVTSSTSHSGVVLVEAYDADTNPDPSSRLTNLSTRGFIGTGDNVLIAGFSVQGPGPRTYLIRVSGKSLNAFGVTGTILDPILTLFGGNSVQLRVDDDWDTPASAQPALNAIFPVVGAFPWPYPSTTNDVRDDTAMQSAMLVTLQPGSYTAQASGNANDGTTDPTGNTLIEIYEVP